MAAPYVRAQLPIRFSILFTTSLHFSTFQFRSQRTADPSTPVERVACTFGMSVGVLSPLLILLTLLLFLLFPKCRAILLGVQRKLLFGRKTRFRRRPVTQVVSMDDRVRNKWVDSPSTSDDVSALPLDLEILLDGHRREAVVRTEYLLAELFAIGGRGQDGEWAKRLVTMYEHAVR